MRFIRDSCTGYVMFTRRCKIFITTFGGCHRNEGKAKYGGFYIRDIHYNYSYLLWFRRKRVIG